MNEVVLNDNAFLVSETNSKGVITFANDDFCKIAEYDREELIGQNHNIVRHDDMPKDAFKDLWETVEKGLVWQGFVKNRTKLGNYYWVYATVYPYINEDGEKCYMSCRRKTSKQNIDKAQDLYRTMS